MSLQLVHLSPEACALRSAAHKACDELFTLSIDAGGLAGLLKLIAGNNDQLNEQEGMAIGVLADMAQRIENEITAIAERLGEARTGDDAPAS